MSSDDEFPASEEELPPEQTEFNLGGAAMDAAVGATMRAAFPPGAPPPDALVAAARERAQQMLEEAHADDAAGLRDMHNLTLTFGLPATRAIFRQMIGAVRLRGAAKRAALQEIAEFSPVTEVGCMKVDFYNQATQRPDAAYLLLDQCPKGHDLGAQLDKIKALVLDTKWPEVLKHLSMLVFLGRSVYANIASQHQPLIRRIFRLAAGDPCDRYLSLQVDAANTTLYLDADWPNRVGIFVRLEAEVGAGAK